MVVYWETQHMTLKHCRNIYQYINGVGSKCQYDRIWMLYPVKIRNWIHYDLIRSYSTKPKELWLIGPFSMDPKKGKTCH